jgi:CheY-like chemotaxis protein
MSYKPILLVEDNPDDVVLALHALAKGQFEQDTMVVRDGKEALDYLFCEEKFADRTKGNPQVILLDLDLPKVDGREVLKKIRSHESTQFIPVIILTASKEEKDKLETLKGGANLFMVKPVDLDQFNKIMQQFLHYWIGLNKGLV